MHQVRVYLFCTSTSESLKIMREAKNEPARKGIGEESVQIVKLYSSAMQLQACTIQYILAALIPTTNGSNNYQKF